MNLTEPALVIIHGITPVPLDDNPTAWNEVLNAQDYVPCDYLLSVVAYQSTYVAEHANRLVVLNAILMDDDKPVAIWPLSLRQQEDVWIIGSNAGFILPPLFTNTATRKQKKAVLRFAFNQINRLCTETGQPTWLGCEPLQGNTTSEWHRQIMEKGARLTARHDLFVDLEGTTAEIKSNFRKSYKPLISKAKTLWQTEIISDKNEEAIEEFRALHIAVAGRETRSKRTWELQDVALEAGEGFMVFLRSPKGVLVGAAFFYHTKQEGVYAVGAYDRDHFDKPLGHLVQFTAIEHMQTLGLKWYHLGSRPYPGDDPTPDDKEMNIAFFKEGFASHNRLALLSECPASDNSPTTFQA